MGTDLQPASRALLPAINTAEPSSILLVPDWLASQLAEVSDLGAGRSVVDPVTRQITARVATIPESRMPTGTQRQAIARRVEDLTKASRPGPIEMTLSHLGELIQEYAPQRLDQETVAIKAEAYLDAVEDLPAWALREAMRRWRRGECDASPSDLDFAPKPARLKRLAERIASVAEGQLRRLERILEAEPEIALTDAQRSENAARLADLSGAVRVASSMQTAQRVGAASSTRDPNLVSDLEARRVRRESEKGEAA